MKVLFIVLSISSYMYCVAMDSNDNSSLNIELIQKELIARDWHNPEFAQTMIALILPSLYPREQSVRAADNLSAEQKQLLVLQQLIKEKVQKRQGAHSQSKLPCLMYFAIGGLSAFICWLIHGIYD